MINEISNKDFIIALCEEAERLGIDIAPDYQPDYVGLAFALSYEMGEEGRQIFHRFCRLSTKYDEKDAEKKYSDMLKKNTGRVQIGTIVYLCRRYGMDTEAVRQRLIESQRKLRTERCSVANVAGGVSETAVSSVNDTEIDTEIDTVELTCDTDPETPLPTFGKLRLPYPLDLIYERGQTPQQCDAMLLAGLTVIGAAMDWHVRTKYSDYFQYPCLQLFLMAPSAAGKGAIARVRELAEPIHKHRLERLPQAEATYEVEMIKYNEKLKAVKDGGEVPAKPQRPVRELFLIPGNNTGTGILQNIIDSGGNGLIFEVEADTVSSAITGDYGHWSDTLRKAFDHERLSYNRRTDQEYKDLRAVRLGVVLSGTPQQLAPLMPSAENGLFSRHIFYFMPHMEEFIDQFDRGNKRQDNTSFFVTLSMNFEKILEKIQAKGIIELLLSDEQMDVFVAHFTAYFKEGRLAFNGEIDSTVFRQAINAVRIMSIVAVLREFEKHDGGGLEKAYRLDQSPSGQECDLHYLRISDEDFLEVLSLFEALYYHSIHVLSFLNSTETERRVLSGWMLALKEMPDEFTREEWNEECEKRKINKNTVRSWIARLLKKGVVTLDEETGKYTKAVKKGKNVAVQRCNAATLQRLNECGTD